MKQQGFRNNQIANVIGKDKSVISRELKRNCDKRSGQYRAEQIWTKNEREAKVDQVHKRAMPACRDNVERGLQSETELEIDKSSDRAIETNPHIQNIIHLQDVMHGSL